MRKTLVVLFSLLLLTVTLGACSSGSLNKVTPEVMDDEAMEADVRAALTKEIDLKAFNISVDVKGGVVTLNGDVDTSSQRTRAGEAVRAINGVRSVVNNLRVRN